MAKELQHFDVTKIPGLLALAEELRVSGEPCLLVRDQEQIAVITPIKPKARRAPRPKKGVLTEDDSFWNIVGIAGDVDDPVTDVSSNKHHYVAEAYATKSR